MNKKQKQQLEKNAIAVISRYYHSSKINRKVKELLESSDGRMMNNQGGASKWANKYYQFMIVGSDVYHRTVYQSHWPSLATFSLDNKRLWVKWGKN